MVWATMTSKGQVTVPKEVRESLSLASGSAIDFAWADGVWIVRRATTSVTSLKGCVPLPRQPVSLDDMDAAVAAGAAETMNR